ncbi:hypothetical protein NL676_008599 [Syzygium grande]|nr:hypothetical protein NL676_008599 [Syzygium grande]
MCGPYWQGLFHQLHFLRPPHDNPAVSKGGSGSNRESKKPESSNSKSISSENSFHCDPRAWPPRDDIRYHVVIAG